MKMPHLSIVAATLMLGVSEARAGDVSAGDVAAGEKRFKVNCVNCHGKTGKGMASFPAITGRDTAYIVDRLTSYRAKQKVGPNSAIMMSLTEELSNADIANLAAYISTTFQ